jgi:hypothetical protein
VTKVERDSNGNISSIEIAHQWAARPNIGRREQSAAYKTMEPDKFKDYSVINHK